MLKYKWEHGSLYLKDDYDAIVTGFMDNMFSIMYDYNEGDIIRLKMGSSESVKKDYNRYIKCYTKANTPENLRADLQIATFVVKEENVPDLNKILHNTGFLDLWLKEKKYKGLFCT